VGSPIKRHLSREKNIPAVRKVFSPVPACPIAERFPSRGFSKDLSIYLGYQEELCQRSFEKPHSSGCGSLKETPPFDPEGSILFLLIRVDSESPTSFPFP
jgi:hypothetical protein